MPFTLANLSEPRAWLRDVVQPALDELIAAPLDIRRAYTALMLVHQHHERIFHYLQRRRPDLLTGASLERFRLDLGNLAPSFAEADAAAEAAEGHTLKYANILSAEGVMATVGGSTGTSKAGKTIARAVIVTRQNRQLIPMLQDVVDAYQRLHESFRI